MSGSFRNGEPGDHATAGSCYLSSSLAAAAELKTSSIRLFMSLWWLVVI